MALTGYLINNVCVENSFDLLTFFNSHFPVVSNGFITSVQGTIFDASNLIIGSNFHTTNLNSGAIADVWAVVNINLCDPAISLTGGVPFDPVLAASYWSFSMTFAFGLYLISSNIGLILQAIKRW